MVTSPVLVSLDKSEAGLLFDVGEGGLSIHGLVPKWRHDPIPIAFDLPEGNGSVYAWVGIAWRSDSKNRTGLRFVKVAERTQQRLKAWVGSKVYDDKSGRCGWRIRRNRFSRHEFQRDSIASTDRIRIRGRRRCP